MRTVICISILIAALFVTSMPLYSQWVQTNGPLGGFVYCITVSGSNLFAGTNCGVFRSTNNGTDWTYVSSV